MDDKYTDLEHWRRFDDWYATLAPEWFEDLKKYPKTMLSQAYALGYTVGLREGLEYEEQDSV